MKSQEATTTTTTTKKPARRATKGAGKPVAKEATVKAPKAPETTEAKANAKGAVDGTVICRTTETERLRFF
jgi:hypothetical protein